MKNNRMPHTSCARRYHISVRYHRFLLLFFASTLNRNLYEAITANVKVAQEEELGDARL